MIINFIFILYLNIKCYIAGVECLAVRISYTGELGWEIYSPIIEMKHVYDSLCNEGKKIFYFLFNWHVLLNNIMRIELISKNDISSDISGKEFNIGHIGTFAVNVLRMEKGTP